MSSKIEPASNALEARAVSKSFGPVTAVDGVDVTVARGEFLTLLGPSGSGKTTMLRMIAGFTVPSAGTIELEGRDITRTPPDKRGIGMVFQNYALFPHMTAAENVGFPLQMRRVPRRESKRRVAEALEIVHLKGLGDRRPRELSGGQQQRVALARAIVFQPRLLLMDEPLGALDRQLRESLQLEILSIRRKIGVTVVYVTHDQEEALAMSDRIAIFNRGKIDQIGSGEDLYVKPATHFVATFVGESTILSGRYERNGGAHLRSELGRWPLAQDELPFADGDSIAVVIRPERLRFAGQDEPGVDASIVEALYLGSTRRYDLALPDGTKALVREQTTGHAQQRSIGDRVRLTWRPEDATAVPLGSGAETALGTEETDVAES